ncbi:hypothetical protein [Flavobacterium gilvum]|uniref:Uncharacterized protein n=1 Tax=Flavobacterium gilvum TaxID=1492737 RepID=A0AAC9N462_9FLAO|nr:hypothetical protein [Flavobacterium gilvum]AOW10165.1 hypothetical protein EM308_11985 [Flavobacterium gilvum]KFC57664.1 hypothetical protein FEM08_35690 [Flavobacterium gilvum]
MKSKTEFLKEDIIPENQFIDQNKTRSMAQQNNYYKVKQKGNTLSSLKVFKGKVEVFYQIKDNKHLDNKSELLLVSQRMLSFLKFTTVFFILILILFVLKNKGVEV